MDQNLRPNLKSVVWYSPEYSLVFSPLPGADPHRFPPFEETVRFFTINIFLIKDFPS